jgi:hypothetical protein
MNTIDGLVDFISNNKIASTLIGAAIVAAATWLVKWLRDRRDSNRIYRHLLKSAAKTEWTFRSTEAISSATHIPTSRVSELCGSDKRFKRNEKEKESWRLA